MLIALVWPLCTVLLLAPFKCRTSPFSSPLAALALHGPLSDERPSCLWEVEAPTPKPLEVQSRRGAGLRRRPPRWPDQRHQPEWFTAQRRPELVFCYAIIASGLHTRRPHAPVAFTGRDIQPAGKRHLQTRRTQHTGASIPVHMGLTLQML